MEVNFTCETKPDAIIFNILWYLKRNHKILKFELLIKNSKQVGSMEILIANIRNIVFKFPIYTRVIHET